MPSSTPPISRSEFLRSRFYRCALAYNKRNELRLKNIRGLLEKVDLKKKNRSSNNQKKRYVSSYVIPASDATPNQCRTSKEDTAVLSAFDKDNEENSWVYDEENGEYVLSLGGFVVMKIPTDMFERLKPFQRDAVKWVASVGPIGGILADDMGMGKTVRDVYFASISVSILPPNISSANGVLLQFMSIASLGARMRVQGVRMALIVAPVSVLAGWAEEGKKFLSKFVSTARIVKVHGKNQQERQKIIRNAWRNSSLDRPHVIISSWGLVANPKTTKAFLPPSGHNWDYVILDEGHEIKNHKTNRNKCCRRICHKPGTKRLLLTGTPFQNNTDELWSIAHMATAGKVLGKIKEFNKEYGKPIKDARCRNAGSYTMKQGLKANEKLQEVLKPYLLRRRKIDFLKDELPEKREICVWVKPSQQQATMYKKKVEENFSLVKNVLSSDVALANKAKMGAFQVLAQLKNLCGHPLRLLKGGPGGDIRSALEQTDLATIINGSKKLDLTVHMLEGFKADSHKTLLFSQSTQNLDVIQHVLLEQGNMSMARLDG